jgi:hypothetical protein
VGDEFVSVEHRELGHVAQRVPGEHIYLVTTGNPNCIVNMAPSSISRSVPVLLGLSDTHDANNSVFCAV